MDLPLPVSRLEVDVDLGFALFFLALLCLFLLVTMVRCAQMVLDPYSSISVSTYQEEQVEVEGIAMFGGLWRSTLAFCQASRPFSTGSCLRIRINCIPKPKDVDRWTEKRSMYGVYDNIGILGDFKAHPKDLIGGPVWVRAFKGNELQRCLRKSKMVGDRMMTQEKLNLDKRIRYLYKRFNRYGKYR
ncbi:hypothetical protein DNTS_002776 [Danionella cerebrum]|uniref:Large ribosomal subunit protein mL51 n=1 Tax=Danionella cerebrum TaxID=2873325 RepID=A0A553MKU6_9TELE|nr:hypothetical protein DNTS_002776 [Danionella translucida]TRY53819.1 hypothetical protein DNTS_002776 [Danionella translucida]